MNHSSANYKKCMFYSNIYGIINKILKSNEKKNSFEKLHNSYKV